MEYIKIFELIGIIINLGWGSFRFSKGDKLVGILHILVGFLLTAYLLRG